MREPRRRTPIGILAALAALILIFAGPPDCSGGNAARIALCQQAVPAIAPEGSKPEILRAGRGSSFDSVRVDYRLKDQPDSASKARWITCRFGPDDNLDSVTTESGALSGAATYLLKRYVLDKPDHPSADAKR